MAEMDDETWAELVRENQMTMKRMINWTHGFITRLYSCKFLNNDQKKEILALHDLGQESKVSNMILGILEGDPGKKAKFIQALNKEEQERPANYVEKMS